MFEWAGAAFGIKIYVKEASARVSPVVNGSVVWEKDYFHFTLQLQILVRAEDRNLFSAYDCFTISIPTDDCKFCPSPVATEAVFLELTDAGATVTVTPVCAEHAYFLTF